MADLLFYQGNKDYIGSNDLQNSVNHKSTMKVQMTSLSMTKANPSMTVNLVNRMLNNLIRAGEKIWFGPSVAGRPCI